MESIQVDVVSFIAYAELLAERKYITGADYAAICTRIKNNAIGFIKDLNEFDSSLTTSFAARHWTPNEHTLKRFRVKFGVLPSFLKSLLQNVFDRENGQMLIKENDKTKKSVRILRQIFAALKKHVPTKRVEASKLDAKAWDACVDAQSRVGSTFSPEKVVDNLNEIDQRLYKRIALNFSRSFTFGTQLGENNFPYSVPQNATFDKLDTSATENFYLPDGISLFQQRDNDPDWFHYSITGEIRGRVPLYLTAPKLLSDLIESTRIITTRPVFVCIRPEPNDVQTLSDIRSRVRATCVPKTFKAARLVCSMGAFNMILQLRWAKEFYNHLTENLPLNDQSKVHSNLSRFFRLLFTVDLSAASDTILRDLLYALQQTVVDSYHAGEEWVTSVFSREDVDNIHKNWEFLASVATTQVVPPNGKNDGEILYNSCMLMGEGITFPVMSAFFNAINRTCHELEYEDGNLRISRRAHGFIPLSRTITGSAHRRHQRFLNLVEILSLLRTYGDDNQGICFDKFTKVLTACGCVVNEAKSFKPDSSFKESCGLDLVAFGTSEPFDTKPSFLVQAKLFEHVDKSGVKHLKLKNAVVLQMLAVANKAYANNPELSDAICEKVINRYSYFGILPKVPHTTTQWGQPSSTPDAFLRLKVSFAKRDYQTISARRSILSSLRNAGSQSGHQSYELEMPLTNHGSKHRQIWRSIMKSKPVIKIESTLKAMALEAFRACADKFGYHAMGDYSYYMGLFKDDIAFLEASDAWLREMQHPMMRQSERSARKHTA